MTRIINIGGTGNTDYYYDLAAGKLPGQSLVHKFGTNQALSTTPEDLWEAGGTLTYLTAAVALEVLSTDSNDTAAGSGAQEVVVYGLDASFNEISEVVVTNGTSASTATTQLFIRVYRVTVSKTGSYGGSNDGALTIRVSGGGLPQAYIDVSKGQTQGAHYTIPRGHKGYILAMHTSVSTTKVVKFWIYIRERADVVSAPFSSWRVLFEGNGFEGSNPLPSKAPLYVPEKTDIKVVGQVTAGSTSEASFDYQIALDHLGVGE